jgi:ADP-heptose:LPS heptosyltransferase
MYIFGRRKFFMGQFKSIEIFFRRLFVRTLKFAIKRRRPLPPGIDFNKCKFLFVRQDRIGDVIVSTPLIAQLKKYYPEAIIDFLLSGRNHFVLQNDPAVRKRWVYTKAVGKTISLMRAIRREKYDFVIDLMDNPSTTSTFICALANGTWNVGLCKENAYAYDIPIPLLSRCDTHIVDRTAQVLTAFNINPKKERLRLYYHISKESAILAERFLANKGLLGTCILAVNVSPAHGIKYWGKENFINFINTVIEVFPSLHMLVLYEPSDMEEAKAIADSHGNRVTLSPETASFDQFAALLKHAAFLVTPDTSAVHLASAFQIPCVALHFQPNKEISIWSSYGLDSENLISAQPSLSTISSADVIQAFRKLYGRHG